MDVLEVVGVTTTVGCTLTGPLDRVLLNRPTPTLGTGDVMKYLNDQR